MRAVDLARAFVTRTKMGALLEKRNKVATENFVRCIVDMGAAQGFDLGNGDKCFIHPGDVPASVKLDASHPVIPSRAIAIVQGHLYFVVRTRLDSALNAPAIITPKTGIQ